MSKKSEKRGLGRGLSALMADIEPETAAPVHQTGTVTAAKSDIIVPIEKVRPNPDQPRQDFGQKDLEELAASIAEKGVIQPIIVRTDPKDENLYQIIAGERRWRASQIALVHDIPIIIREMDDTEVLEVAIIENVQRADLNPVEEALGFRQLMDNYGHTQEQLAKALGKSRSHIANILRLLSLPEDVLQLLRSGQISSGHARAMVSAENPSKLAVMVVAKGLSVRETERLARASHGDTEEKPKAAAPRREKDADTVVLENDLAANLNMKVSIDHKEGMGGGGITISYKSLDELDALCQLLSSNSLGESK